MNSFQWGCIHSFSWGMVLADGWIAHTHYVALIGFIILIYSMWKIVAND